MDIEGKVALVTGGAVRVGKAISLGLAREGASVALHYNRSQNEALRTVSEIESFGAKAVALEGDFLSVEQIERVVNACLETFGRIDILVNNAAVYFKTRFGQTQEGEWDALVNVNLKAPFFCAQLASQTMLEQKRGKIINITDIAGIAPWPDYIPYCTSKSGLIALTKGLAKALAPHIQVNAIASGTVLFQEETQKPSQAELIDQTLLKRVGNPQDIVNTVIFLVQGSDFITGEVIAVDGGRLLAHG